MKIQRVLIVVCLLGIAPFAGSLNPITFSSHAAPLSATATPRATVVSTNGDELSDELNDPFLLDGRQGESTIYLPTVFKSFTCTGVTEIPQDECAALSALGNGSLEWLKNEMCSFETNSPCSSPYVSCEDGHVVTLMGYCFAYFHPHPFVSAGLSGDFPPEVGNLSQLRVLGLSGNALTGPIPPSLGQLSQLTALMLCDNALSGSIPAELGGLTELRRFDLARNQLSGSIPVELGRLSNLSHLDLSGNQLSGTIPSELGQLVNLTDLNLAANELSGAIPPEIGNLTQLKFLYLYANHLSGPVPLQLQNLTQLASLILEDNAPSLCVPPALRPFVESLFSYIPPPGGFCVQQAQVH